MALPRIISNPFCLVALVLVSIGIWQAYAPLLRDKDAVIALTRSTQEITAAQLLEKSVSTNGKPTLVYLYASWCNICRVTTPLLASYIRNRKLEDVNLLFVAMEHDGYSLAGHLQQKDYGGLWKPYFMKGKPDASLSAISPDAARGIPLLMLLDKNGTLLAQKAGALQTDDIDDLIATMRTE